jgi:proteic killer suppression protein
VIRNFRDRDTEKVFRREQSKAVPQNVQRVALRKLVQLDAAANLLDLKVPPGNRLEALAGRRTGQFSIRINDQWRIRFVWKDGHVHEVEIVDYH